MADALSEEVIIGAKTMQAWRLKMNVEQDRQCQEGEAP